MKFFYELKSFTHIDNLLKSLVFIKTSNPNIINIATNEKKDIKKISTISVKVPALYLANQKKQSNKYVCNELLLSLTSIIEEDTKLINYFLSELENFCMLYIKNNKLELFDTDEPLIFKSVILSINDVSNSSEQDSNHFESEKEYCYFSESKQIIHDFNDIYNNGGIKLKLINSSNFISKVLNDNNDILQTNEYENIFQNNDCFIESYVSISLWRHHNIVGLYLRPYELKIKQKNYI